MSDKREGEIYQIQEFHFCVQSQKMYARTDTCMSPNSQKQYLQQPNDGNKARCLLVDKHTKCGMYIDFNRKEILILGAKLINLEDIVLIEGANNHFFMIPQIDLNSSAHRGRKQSRSSLGQRVESYCSMGPESSFFKSSSVGDGGCYPVMWIFTIPVKCTVF